MPDDPFYNGNCMVDCMNKDATKAFLESTHEKYKERFGHLFGTDIKGIFTDEPCRGPMFTGFTHISPNSENLIPYTYVLFDEFKKRKGYSLEDKLPELWFGLENEVFLKTTYDYVEILEELFLENFAKPYHDWCTQNKLKFVGHILHEDNLAAQVNMSGSMMRFYEYFDYPGMDNLGTDNFFYNVPALVNSVAKQLDKEYVLDELYGVSGWPMRIEDYKRIGDWQSAGGVTFRVPHLCWYTMKGEAKRDCPASIFHQSSWYEDYHYLEDYYARLTYLLKNGKQMTDIAIINPIESVWGLANQFAYQAFMSAKEETFVSIENQYRELYKGLVLNGVTPDYIDEGLFAKYGKVTNGSFSCGKMNYKTIILNANLNLRKTTLDAIKAFTTNGGKVILVGELPRYLDGIRYDFTNDLKNTIKVEFDIDKLISLLDEDIVSTSSKNMIVAKRSFKDDLFVLFLNRQDNEEQVKIRVKTNKKPTLVNLRTGEIEFVEYRFDNNEVIIDKSFTPNEELALYFSNEINVQKKEELSLDKEVILDEFEYELLEDNFLVLNKCNLYFNEELISSNYSIYTDIDLRKKLGISVRGNQMLQPWFQEKYFPEQNVNYGVARLHYEFNVEILPKDVKIMFELQKNERILVNGQEIDLSSIEESPIDCCFNIAHINDSLFKNGLNSIDVIFDYYFTSNIEDHYLMGKFGVKLGEKDTIISLPKTLKAGNVNYQGLPYFGGKLLLKSKLENGDYQVSVDKMGVASIKANGVPIIFSPYQTITGVKNDILSLELSFTRQNTFGIITVSNIIEGIKEQYFDIFKIRKVR